jgi:hypothetical protein
VGDAAGLGDADAVGGTAAIASGAEDVSETAVDAAESLTFTPESVSGEEMVRQPVGGRS